MGHHSYWLVRDFGLRMKRYFLKTKAADYENGPDSEDYLARTIYQAEPQAIKTGLLNAQGNDIYMINEPEPIGFIRWESMIRFKPIEETPMKKKPAPKAKPSQKPMPKKGKGKKR